MTFRTNLFIIFSSIIFITAIPFVLYHFGKKDIMPEKKNVIIKVPVDKITIVK